MNNHEFFKHTNTSGNFTADYDEEYFSEGRVGKIKEVKIEKGGHSINLVSKEFNSNSEAEDSVNYYKILKKSGIKKLPVTYRYEKDSPKIIMSDLTKGGVFLVLSTNNNERNKETDIISINEHSLREMLTNVLLDIIKASESGIKINGDSYFFTIPTLDSENRKGGNIDSIDYVIADLDDRSIEIIENSELSEEEIFIFNIKKFTLFLLGMMNLYISDRNAWLKYQKIIKEWFESNTKDKGVKFEDIA